VSPPESFFIGVDVGTGSARVGVVDAKGRIHGTASSPIRMWKPQADFVEQSSDDIWEKCCTVVRRAVQQTNIAPNAVAGLGFDATCSLVVFDANGEPVSVSPTDERTQNVIVWSRMAPA
jgi:ribulose kinase